MINLEILNPQQREAVTTTDGAVLVLAGAGSGKTRVLTYRIAYLLEQRLAYPEQILAVTFTNKAAGEMKERIASLIDGQANFFWAGTFHSICVKILRREGHLLGLGSNFTIYDSSDQLEIVKQAMEKLNISQKDVNPRAIHSFISNAKNEMVSASDYASYAQGYFQELVAQVYPQYQKLLKENNSVDFDDLLLYVVQLLQENAEVLAKYQEMFKYILVDEYQDTNHVQYMMMNLLSKKHGNICVVGDDDQSIYSFRGATIKNILNFERDYPNAKVIKLEQNYRSTEVILNAAYEVVRKNKNRTAKKLWTDQSGGEKIGVYTARDERDEAKWVVDKIKLAQKEGASLDEVAVLYRTNAQSRALEEEFLHQAVNYRVVGGVRFYDRKEIKDILAYLQMLYNPKNDTALMRIINVPRRGIGNKTIEDISTQAAAQHLSATEYLLQKYAPDTVFITQTGKMDKKLVEFATLVRQLLERTQKYPLVELVNYILDATGYLEMLNDGTAENEARVENIKELLTVANKYNELAPQDGLASFLEEVALLEEGSQKDTTGSAVTLMTIHAAKGLEFEHVFVVGMEEGLFPHSRVFTEPKELEEERRLAYVAITRAKRVLHLVHAESRLFFGNRQNNMASRFLQDIPEEFIVHTKSNKYGDWDVGWDEQGDDWEKEQPKLNLRAGQRVRHEYFGVGKLVAVGDHTVKIDFGGMYGTKELARDLAPLHLVD